MNHIYKTIYNLTLGLWQAVAESARGQGKSRRAAAAPLLIAGLLAGAGGAQADDNVVDTNVTVDGAGSPSSLTNTSGLVVGNIGTGTLTIQNGGMVSSRITYVGNLEMGSTGTVTVDGAGSTWTNAGTLYLGHSGTGTLTVQNSGVVSSEVTFLASRSGSTGTLHLLGDSMARGVLRAGKVIQGPGTAAVDWNGGILRATGDQGYYLQGFAANAITIGNNGAFFDTNGYNVGISYGLSGTGGFTKLGTGTLTLTGANSYSGDTTVEGGTLKISGGGKVSDAYGWIGSASGSNGSVMVDGAGSTWTNSSNQVVGYNGTGKLTVQNGGTVRNSDTFVGDGSGSIGTVTVDGAGSTLTSSNALHVGNLGTGTLTVQNGGAVKNSNMFISGSSASIGSVTVDGAGSSLTISGVLAVGLGGTGTLTVQNGGTVNVAGMTVGLGNGSTGILNLLGNTTVRGVLQTGLVARSAGTATFNWNGGILRATSTQSYYLQGFGAGSVTVGSNGAWFDTNGYNVGFTTAYVLGGTGGFTKQGAGTLSIAGANTYGGNTTVSAGTLQFGSYNQSASQTLGIGASSNSSYGRLAVTGTATFAAGTNLAVDVASANTLAVGQRLSSVVSAGTLNASTFNVTDNSALFNFKTVLNGNALDLDVVSSSSTGLSDAVRGQGLQPAVGAARVLDTLVNGTPSGDMSTVVTALGTLNNDRALARAAAQTLPLQTGLPALQGLLGSFNRLLQSRVGLATAFAAAPSTFSASTFASLASSGAPPLAAGWGQSSGLHMSADAQAFSGPAWARTFGVRADQADAQGSAGFGADTSGLALGGETLVNADQRLGLSYAYASTRINGNSSLAGSAQNAGIDTHVLALYGWFPLKQADLSLGWQTDLGLSHNKGARAVNFGGLNRTASSEYASYSAHAGVSLARSLTWDAATTVTPMLRADYTWLGSDAYTESGAGALNLQVGAQSTDALVLGSDLQLTRSLSARSHVTGTLGLGYDTFNKRNSLVAAYAGAPTQAFTTTAAEPSPWLGRVGVEYAYALPRGGSFSLQYEAQVRGALLSQSAAARAVWQF